jgi:hypothetical protein
MNKYLLAAIPTGLVIALIGVFRNDDSNRLIESTTQSVRVTSLDSQVAHLSATHQASVADAESLPRATWQDLIEGAQGVSFRSIEQLDYEPALMQQMYEDLESFQRYGSIGKGRVTTEFTATAELRKALEANGLPSMLAGLAFQPVLLPDLLSGEASLIGAVEQGKRIEDLGWAGLFQSALHKDGVRQLELSEVQEEFAVGDSVEVIKEFLNGTVGDVPATIQRMLDEQGARVFTIEWTEKNRTFTLSTKAYDEAEALELSRRIQQRYRELPYAGWRQPYRLDPQRPWHRMAKDGK